MYWLPPATTSALIRTALIQRVPPLLKELISFYFDCLYVEIARVESDVLEPQKVNGPLS